MVKDSIVAMLAAGMRIQLMSCTTGLKDRFGAAKAFAHVSTAHLDRQSALGLVVVHLDGSHAPVAEPKDQEAQTEDQNAGRAAHRKELACRVAAVNRRPAPGCCHW